MSLPKFEQTVLDAIGWMSAGGLKSYGTLPGTKAGLEAMATVYAQACRDRGVTTLPCLGEAGRRLCSTDVDFPPASRFAEVAAAAQDDLTRVVSLELRSGAMLRLMVPKTSDPEADRQRAVLMALKAGHELGDAPSLPPAATPKPRAIQMVERLTGRPVPPELLERYEA